MLKFMNFMILGIMTHMQCYNHRELLELLENKKKPIQLVKVFM